MAARTFSLSRGLVPLFSAAILVAGLSARAQLALVQPSVGDQYTVGDTMPIVFDADENSVQQVEVEISLDGGETWLRFLSAAISFGGPGWEDTSWVIPEKMLGAPPSYDSIPTVSSECLVRVINYVNRTMRDQTDGPFSIADVPVDAPPPVDDEDDDSGCGNGTGAALLPPLVLKLSRRWRRRRKRP